MKDKKKWKPNKIDKIEKEMRKQGKRYADYQMQELEKKRKWWIKGGTNGN